MVELVEVWLKTTIPGIVLLGALGSILAAVILRFLAGPLRRVLPNPFALHQRRRSRQAFMLGYMHAHIERDGSSRSLIAFLTYRCVRLVLAVALVMACYVEFLFAVAMRSQIALTASGLPAVIVGFLSLYWAYFEFEYIYRSYLFIWAKQLEGAEKSYGEGAEKTLRDGRAADDTSPYL